MSEYKVELIPDVHAQLGEGPNWIVRDQVLLWVDIDKMTVNFFDPKNNTHKEIQLDSKVGTAVTRKHGGGVVVAIQKGLANLDVETGRYEVFASPEEHIPSNRFNDGKCDIRGRFWAGTMDSTASGAPVGALYTLETDGKTLTKKVSDVGISNGLTWSLDHKTMYYIDSPLRRIDAFDYNVETGEIANRRTIINVPKGEGIPDGMTIDEEGKLWVALWEGSAITRWDPVTGNSLLKIPLPAKRITSASFGGPDLSELYVTSASKGDPYPNGALFRITNLGVKGVPEPQFG
eukprot:TRINITY_DN5152_c0_g1_i1.p1 TRINITY_DN5152_c0_g1~~TRINITY_DN5152_c0_g1_i1.p1  ORF type:complete len:290 (-),score=65.00 TRINITY_DN5152_c0_g1_i1:23-892(-)